MPPSHDDEHPLALWQQVMQESRPLEPSHRIVKEPLSPKYCKQRMRERASAHEVAWLSALPAVSARVPDRATMQDVGACRFDARLKKRLGRGSEKIDVVLDLHGLTMAQAHTQLHHTLSMAHHRAQRTVLVITGKGKDGEGVLRRSLPVWLDAEVALGVVQGYDTAAVHHGGSGAFYVRVRAARKTTTDEIRE